LNQEYGEPQWLPFFNSPCCCLFTPGKICRFDSTENKRDPVERPNDAPCNKIIAVLVQKLRLPTNGPDGAPLSYKFHHKNSGRQIQDTQTLGDAHAQDGDILRLPPEITAG
jgi:hypothetical protein